MPHDKRDEIVDFVNSIKSRVEMPVSKVMSLLSIRRSRFYEWKDRYGKANEHNGMIHRDNWLTDDEKDRIIRYFTDYPNNGYKRLTYMMMDDNVAYCSPRTTYNVLKEAGLMGKRDSKVSKKGKGFQQPLKAHEHWHVDVSYINVSGTFYYLCSVLDGYSRLIVHHEIREQMTETDVETIVQRALEKHTGVSPRIISDNGPQFISRDFKTFIRVSGMDHVRTSPYYPQSNGKIERFYRELKSGCIRAEVIDDLATARVKIDEFIDHYNNKRLHASIGYISPKDKLEGREDEIFAERDRKLEEARKKRKLKRMEERARLTMPDEGYGSAGEQPEQHLGLEEQLDRSVSL